MIQQLSLYPPVSVRFANRLNKGEHASYELFPTAIARCAKEKTSIIMDCRRHTCDGGNYFMCGKNLSTSTLEDIYIQKEGVFKTSAQLHGFLKKVGRNRTLHRYVIFEPTITSQTSIVIFITSPAQAGKLLGLSAYLGILNADTIPAMPTCTAIFRPLVRQNRLHLNFIDYFDRDYQCKNFFKDTEMLVSMHIRLFKKLEKIYPRSCHGAKPLECFTIDPQTHYSLGEKSIPSNSQASSSKL